MRTEQSDSSSYQPLAQGLDGPAGTVLAKQPVLRDRAPEAFGCIRQYVDAHLDSRLDVQALAQMIGMSASHFSRSFHKAVGVSPHMYVLQCRVLRAQELLATTQLPLAEIALTIGFADQSHFSRRFHELTGVPPRKFRTLAGHSPR